MKKIAEMQTEEYGATAEEIMAAGAMKFYLLSMESAEALRKVKNVYEPKVIRLDSGEGVPVQSIVDGAKYAAFIDEAIADAVKRIESDTSDIGQIALEALRDIDGKVIVEAMSPEFVSFVGDAYRSLKLEK